MQVARSRSRRKQPDCPVDCAFVDDTDNARTVGCSVDKSRGDWNHDGGDISGNGRRPDSLLVL
jgi:hypothetical protein